MYKTCKSCQEHKPLDDFHKHPKGQFGRYNKCKCCRQQEYLRQPLYSQSERIIKCSRCCAEKSREEFYMNRSNKTGTSNLCKYCHKLAKKDTIDDYNRYIDKLIEKYNNENDDKIEKEQLLEIIKNQNTKCAITKHDFTFLINRDGTLDHIWNMRILNKNVLVCDFIYSASRIYGYNYEQLQTIYKELSI